VLKLEDTYTQAAGKAELWLSLATGSTIPALLVEHGTPTLSLTKTQLNLFNSAIQATATSLNLFSSAIQATPTSLNLFSNAVQATSAGAVTAATLNATTSVAIKNNTSLLEFRDTADAVQFASITGSTSGLDLNLPDTADSYTFKINNVTKAVINNNGIDGQYVYGSTNTTAVIRYQRTFSYFAIGGYRVMASTTISINGPKTGILSFGPGNSPTISQGYDYGGIQPFTVSPDNARFKILIKNGGNIYYEGWYTNFNGGYLQGTVNTTQIFITTFSMPVAGTYTIEFQAAAPFQDVYWGVFPIQILVYTI
ncbi:MAG: hypothetical protein EB078_07515, partial [Proteobacteria bacterium]|nr:hypothetical protein [Pseudomonadota bacterium]NDD04738.1 hypothetical protein [Pseudomonadota bacterium]